LEEAGNVGRKESRRSRFGGWEGLALELDAVWWVVLADLSTIEFKAPSRDFSIRPT